MTIVPLSIDEALIARHASHQDGDVEDRVFTMAAGDGRCLALLHRPVRTGVADLGFVVCHSYGEEFQNLRRLERSVARAIAARGFPVLRFDRRGYGDSTGSLAGITLEGEVDDTRAAAARLTEETAVVRVGLIGARFGALVAGLLAREGGVDKLLLMNPALQGQRYVNDLIKQMRIAQLTPGAPAPTKRFREHLQELSTEGMLNVIGYPLYEHLYHAVSAVDLTEDIGSFSGDALVIHASKGSAVPRPYDDYRVRVEAAGGACTIVRVAEPPGVTFGQAPYMATTDPVSREYLYGPMAEQMSGVAARWVAG
jgi:pimeloyl-ACP methyl ester carboxylesterase